MTSPPSIAVVMTVHNRRETTRRCLAALEAQTATAGRTTIVFDDGSTDGTAEMVAAQFPDVTVLRGDGSFFWNGGMRVAMAAARRRDPDYYLWINDDTSLEPTALADLLTTVDAVGGGPATPLAVVGAVTDPDDGTVAYSGVLQQRWQPMRFDKLEPTGEPIKVQTMNGNCALLSRAAVALVGNLDSAYTHGMGDYHYGFALTKAGGSVWMAPGVLGHCHANPGFVAKGESIRADLATLRSTKFLPPDEWAHFVRAWGGPIWPLFWASPYVMTTLRLLREKLRGGGLQLGGR